MKLVDNVISRICEFLELKDVMENKLWMVNKQFYALVLGDQEFMTRKIVKHLGIVYDLDKEQEYQKLILRNVAEARAGDYEEEKYQVEETYKINREDILGVVKRVSQKSNSKLLLCAYRVTGGYQEDPSVI